MDWIVLDEAKVLADFPTDLRVVYDSWIIDYPDKAGRLVELVAEFVARIRDSIASEPSNILDPDGTTIPLSAVHAAETLIFGTVGMEIGIELTTEATQMMTRAELFLSQIAYGHLKTTSAGSVMPAPTYSVPLPVQRALPALLGLLVALWAGTACAGWLRPQSTGGGGIVLPDGTPLTNINAALLQGVPASGFLLTNSASVKSNHLATGAVSLRSLAANLRLNSAYSNDMQYVTLTSMQELRDLVSYIQTGEVAFAQTCYRVVIPGGNMTLTPSGGVFVVQEVTNLTGVYVSRIFTNAAGVYNGPPPGTFWNNPVLYGEDPDGTWAWGASGEWTLGAGKPEGEGSVAEAISWRVGNSSHTFSESDITIPLIPHEGDGPATGSVLLAWSQQTNSYVVGRPFDPASLWLAFTNANLAASNANSAAVAASNATAALAALAVTSSPSLNSVCLIGSTYTGKVTVWTMKVGDGEDAVGSADIQIQGTSTYSIVASGGRIYGGGGITGVGVQGVTGSGSSEAVYGSGATKTVTGVASGDYGGFFSGAGIGLYAESRHYDIDGQGVAIQVHGGIDLNGVTRYDWPDWSGDIQGLSDNVGNLQIAVTNAESIGRAALAYGQTVSNQVGTLGSNTLSVAAFTNWVGTNVLAGTTNVVLAGGTGTGSYDAVTRTLTLPVLPPSGITSTNAVLWFPAVSNVTTYVAKLEWDATNKVFTVSETPQ